MASILEEGKPSIFYKAPIPLIFGNLPINEDFKEHKDEYHYFNYYIVPSQYTNNNTLALNKLGIVFYSEYLKNYVYMRGTITNDLTWKDLYPRFVIRNQHYLNPFVNVNGACSWIQENEYEYTEFSVYFNFKEDRYEYGLGEDINSLNDVYFTPIASDYGNGDNVSIVSFNNVDTNESLTNYSLENSGSNYVTPFRIFPSQFVYNDMVISDINSIPSSSFKCKNIATLNSTYETTTYFQKAYSSDIKYQYLRTNDIPDFDYENNQEGFEEMCGIYKNNENKTFVLGSIILGNEENKDFGYFIGVNGLTSPLNDLSLNFLDDNTTPVGASNAYSTADGDYIIHLGYNITGDEKKSLVFLRTANTEGLFKKDRVFIFDGYPEELFDAKKIWYAELPNMQMTKYAPYLFEKPFSYFGTTFNELIFNYVNLEDEKDTKTPISIDVVGATRINPNMEILGLSLNKKYAQNINNITSIQTNTYIGYWQTPITKIIEE